MAAPAVEAKTDAPTSPVPAAGAAPATEVDLQTVYMDFCRFGNKANIGEMDNATFAKFCKETKLINKTLTKTDVDLIFTKVKPKGGRKLTYAHFLAAMDHLAAKRFAKTLAEQGQAAATAKAIALVTSSGGPASSGTKAAAVKLHDDKSTYTGVYAKGGPTNVDGVITLSSLADRSAADARGRKK